MSEETPWFERDPDVDIVLVGIVAKAMSDAERKFAVFGPEQRVGSGKEYYRGHSRYLIEELDERHGLGWFPLR